MPVCEAGGPNSNPDKFLDSNLRNKYRRKRDKHTCETTRLLQELQEEPICTCYEHDEDYIHEISSEYDFSDFQNINKAKSPNKSKQLIIYNDKGCMKGLEVEKEIITDGSTNFEDDLLREMSMKEPYVLIKDKIDLDSYDCSSNSTIPTNNNFNYKPEVFDITDSDTADTINLVSQTFPQYTFNQGNTLPRIRKKKRGWQKGRPRKVSANIESPRINIRGNNRHARPYPSAFLEQQSYTQEYFEEVHLAPPKNSAGQSRKRASNKSPNEMLLLKRKIHKKIFHTTGSEYPPPAIPEHYHSNINSAHHFTNSPQSNQIVKADQSRKQLVKVTSAKVPNFHEKYGPELLPPGWDTEVVRRKTGKSAGQIDIYFKTPEGKRLRSKAELATYIEKNHLPFLPDEFIFRKSAYKNMLPMIEYPASSSQ